MTVSQHRFLASVKALATAEIYWDRQFNDRRPDGECYKVPMFGRFQLVARYCCVVFLGIALVVSSAHAAHPDTVLGTWATEDGHGVVAIEQCGEALCGRIVGIVRTPGEPMPTDVHGASLCGLTIISKEHPTDDGSWLGEITDPHTGTTYGAKLRIDDGGNLRLRAFLGLPLLGETRIWHPFTGHLIAACGLA